MFPPAIPLTIPELLMVAMEGEAELQLPPNVVFESVVDAPAHTLVFPVITSNAGSGFSMKVAELVAVPCGVVREMVPEVAPFGKVAVT